MNTKPVTSIEGNKKTTKKAEKRSYSIKQKLFPSILLSLAIPLTVCLFGPFDIYLANMSEFRYSLTDFMPLCAAGALFFAALFLGILMLLKGRAYEIVCGIMLSSVLLMVAQRAFLNMGFSALVDGGKNNVDIFMLVINALIWVLVIGGTVTAVLLLRNKHGEMVDTVTVIAMITVIGMQAVSMMIYSVTSDVWTPVDERKELSNEDVGSTAVLNFDGFSDFSSEKNVVVFIVDRFDSSYYDEFVEMHPDFFSKLDGFTYYNDYTTLHSRTYPAVASILTEYENDFSSTRIDYFQKAYANGGAIKRLHDNGYKINLYTKEYYAYDNAAVMESYVDNIAGVTGYYIDEYFLLAADMVRLSFSDYLPFAAKWTMGYMKTSEFNAHAKYTLENSTQYDSDLKVVKDHMEGSEFVTVEDKGQFTFIHLDGCHTPLKYDKEWNENWSHDTETAILLNFEIIFNYIEQMKMLGIYESSTIVITGDHAWSVSDYLLIGGEGFADEGASGEEESAAEGDELETEEYPGDGRDEDSEKDRGVRVTSMFFKKSGDCGEPLKTSSAQISQDELWNTIFESEGLLELKGDGISFFDIKEGEDRERRYFLQVDANFIQNKLTEDHVIEYKITGTALDPENWEIVNKLPIGDLYK